MIKVDERKIFSGSTTRASLTKSFGDPNANAPPVWSGLLICDSATNYRFVQFVAESQDWNLAYIAKSPKGSLYWQGGELVCPVVI